VKVPTTALRAEVALVERALIDDLDVLRDQFFAQGMFNCVRPSRSVHCRLLSDGHLLVVKTGSLRRIFPKPLILLL
jgi:hypothetical protein